MEPVIDCSIVLPSYNSAAHLEKRVLECERILENTRWTWEILLCDDGSRDQSPTICRRLAEQAPNRRCFLSGINRGRGKNVSDAFKESRGRWIGFMDVDFSTSAAYIIPAILALKDGFAVAIAHRSYTVRPREFPFIVHRIAAHIVYARMVSLLLGIKGHDTESGFKFFHRDVALRLINATASAGWFWDTEIVALAHKWGYKVAEIDSLFLRAPQMGSTVRLLRDSWVQGRSLLRFAWSLRQFNLRRECCTR